MWTRVSSAVLVMAVTVLGALPGTGEAAHGGDPHSDAVFYELTEHALFKDGLRQATSSLEGSARRGSPLCPEGLQSYAKAAFATAGIRVKIDPRCAVVAVGSSEVSLTTFSGTISGNFWVVVNSDATNLTDAQELVIMAGSFEGNVQVIDPPEGHRIAVLPGSTFTPEWVLEGFPKPSPATFSGTFRLPFTVHHIAVYETDRGRLVPVLPNERALGRPNVRLEVDFDLARNSTGE